MKYNMKKIGRLATLAVFGAVLTVSCTDNWDDHYDDAVQSGGTTLSYLQEHASDFAEVLKAAGYDEKLKSSQVLTILAPQDDSFDKDALLAMIEAGDKEDVVKRFLDNHIMLYPVSLNNDPKTVNLLNEKKVHFGTLDDKLIEGVRVVKENIVCGNGIIHILESDIEYKPNVMEGLQDNYKRYLAEKGIEDSDDIISLYNFLKKYDADSLDEAHSVEFGMDEMGNTIYSDSVMIRNNTILRTLNAYLYREDSIYWAIDPGVENYQRLYNEALTFYNFNDAYAEDVVRRDSMQRFYAQTSIIGEFFFNANLNQGDAEAETTRGDSLVTTQYSRRDWKHHCYKAPFTEGILSKIDDKLECSNGYVFSWPDFQDTSDPINDESSEGSESSALPLSVYDAFFHDIKIQTNLSTRVPYVEGRLANLQWTNDKTSTQVNNGTSNDSVSNGYLKVEATSPANKPLISFGLSNTLSGTYDIYIVILPWSVYDPEVDPAKMIPVKFKSWLFEADAKNEITYLPNDPTVHNFTPGRDDFVDCIHATMVDTVYVGTHTFQYCYKNTSAQSSYLKLSLERTAAERTQGRYDNKFLIDFIYLVPHREGEDPKERFQDRFKQPAEDSDGGDDGESNDEETSGES